MSVENIWTGEASIERFHKTTSKTRHHDQMKSIQVNSAQHVKSRVEVEVEENLSWKRARTC